MMVRMRYVVMVIPFMVVGWIGWSVYQFLFDTTTPHMVLAGLQPHGYYTGDLPCAISTDKSGELNVWLDEKPIVKGFRMRARQDGHAFVIPTKTLSDGSHTLRAVFMDNRYHKNKAELLTDFSVDNTPLHATMVKSSACPKVLQGRTLHLQFQTNKPIARATAAVLSNTYDCFPEAKNSLVYECFVPIACEENPNEYLMTVDIEDGVGNKVRLDDKFQVVMYPFKTSVLHVSAEKVKAEQELGEDRKRFEELVAELTRKSPREKLWRGVFCTPIDISRVTTEYGTVRTTQHKGRYAHKALDVVNMPRSVVWATQDGNVVLRDRFADSGNTVIIDHGWGILSLFFHLEEFAPGLHVGQKIAKGNPVGTLGNTGYARGYHLHWEQRLGNVPVDPMQWTKPTF